MRALSLLLSIAALLTVPSCSFLGLDNLPVAGCTMDSQCDGLERLEPPASECETWQCNGGFCELATRDEDEDGVSPMLSPSMLMCTQPGDPIDCDDGAGVTFPGNPEVCDGLDNDCDGLVDQGQPGVMLGADRSFTTITGSALSAVVANGGGLDGTELAGLFVVTGTPRNQLVFTGRDVTDRALSLMVGPTPSAPNRLVGLAPVSQRWAVLFVPGGSCDRLALAAFNATDSVVNVDPPLHTAGLPTEAGAMCNTATRGSLAPNSGSDRHLLVAYTNAAAALRDGEQRSGVRDRRGGPRERGPHDPHLTPGARRERRLRRARGHQPRGEHLPRGVPDRLGQHRGATRGHLRGIELGRVHRARGRGALRGCRSRSTATAAWC
jgi:hypothetical protein